MKFFGVLLTGALAAGLIVMTSAHSTAGGPPGKIAAQCHVSFTADPAWYTSAQLNSDIGVKYKCYHYAPLDSPSWFHPGYAYVCSSGFTPMLAPGPDAPGVVNLKTQAGPQAEERYFCISHANIR
jgi:hypothetical protein